MDGEMFVSMDYVYRRLNHPATRIIDARDAEVCFGAGIEPWTDKAGHIPMAAGVLSTPPESSCAGQSKDGEIIVYCGVGGYASSWWFILTQVLGFTNVRYYNGAAQQWGLHYDMVSFQWE